MISAKERHAEHRRIVLRHYGAVCACCGSTYRLAIDHVNGDGARHREEVPSGHFYRWLIDNGFPEGFQTLCQPCNSSKRHAPRCRLDHSPQATAARAALQASIRANPEPSGLREWMGRAQPSAGTRPRPQLPNRECRRMT